MEIETDLTFPNDFVLTCTELGFPQDFGMIEVYALYDPVVVVDLLRSIYRKKQQELEGIHEDVEYELRCLMDKPGKENDWF